MIAATGDALASAGMPGPFSGLATPAALSSTASPLLRVYKELAEGWCCVLGWAMSVSSMPLRAMPSLAARRVLLLA